MPSPHHAYLRSLARNHGLNPAPGRLDHAVCQRALRAEARQVLERLHALKEFTDAALALRADLLAGRPAAQPGPAARRPEPADLVAYLTTLAARHDLLPADGQLEADTFATVLRAEKNDLLDRARALHRVRTALGIGPALAPLPAAPTGTGARPTPTRQHGRPCSLRHGSRQTPHWHR